MKRDCGRAREIAADEERLRQNKGDCGRRREIAADEERLRQNKIDGDRCGGR
jgi:hypothetical protein